MQISVRPALVCVLACSTFVPSLAQAPEAHSSQTQRPASPFLLPTVKRDSLLNGLQLIVLEQPGTGNVLTRLRINSGALFDLAGKGGLADLTAGMLLKGSVGFNAKNIADLVEQSGLTINVTAGWDTTDILISGPTNSFDSIFDLLGRLVTMPAFDQKELDALKAVRIAAVKLDLSEDAETARRKAVASVFGTHPFGRPARGTAESIAQITRQDLVYYYTRFYLANNAELYVTGDAAAEQVTKLARAKLGAWKKGEKVPATFRPPEPRSGSSILIMDRPDAQVAKTALAQIGFSRREKDYFASLIMSDLLAQSCSGIAVASPGTTVVLEHEARLLAGPLIVKITSSASDLPGLIDSVESAMVRLQAAPPGIEQVESAKSRLITSMAEKLKGTDGASEVFLDIETYGLGRDYLINFAERVGAITPVEVQRAAQNYLKPKSSAVVIAGPASKLEGALKSLGTVKVSK